MSGAHRQADRVLSPSATEPVVSAHSGNAPLRGATSFLVACFKKTRAELVATLDDPAKLSSAASYHNIPTDWARFWMKEEAHRNDRRR